MVIEKDLVYTNREKEDIGALIEYKLDLSYGDKENDFLLEIPKNGTLCTPGGYIYVEGTEYGGIIDETRVNTETGKVNYYGRTFHGILNSKVIEPDSGFAYYRVYGDANEVLKTIIERMDLGTLFRAEAIQSGILINNYQFDRYCKGYEGIRKMLRASGAKLEIEYRGNYIVLSAVPIGDYRDNELDSNDVDFKISQRFSNTNHLICLGPGNLTERQIIHLYADEEGNISSTQTFFGESERTDLYDYPNVESLDELRKSGEERLKKAWEGNEIKITVRNTREYDIGDIVSGKERITGIYAEKEILQKIVTITNGKIKVEYE